jgi:hypothetical protein
MATQNSKRNTKGVKNENNNTVNNPAANSPKRVVVTRDEYSVVYDHAVSLVVAYSCGHKVEDPRKGFAFGPASNGSHTRNYAKSLIWGFATNKALKGLKAQDGKKDLKVLDELTDKAKRVKIAIAILTDCSLVKGDSKAIEASLNKVEPKRERVFAESVLAGLMAEETKATTPKGGKGKAADTKATAPKGSKAKGESKPKTKATAPKGAKANGKTKAGK